MHFFFYYKMQRREVFEILEGECLLCGFFDDAKIFCGYRRQDYIEEDKRVVSIILLMKEFTFI